MKKSGNLKKTGHWCGDKLRTLKDRFLPGGVMFFYESCCGPQFSYVRRKNEKKKSFNKPGLRCGDKLRTPKDSSLSVDW